MTSPFKYVVQFEVMRTLKKPSFWFLTLLMPLFLVGFSVLGSLGGASAGMASNIDAQEDFTFVYQDEAGVVAPEIAQRYGGEVVTLNKPLDVELTERKVDAVIVIPEDLTNDAIKVVAQDRGPFANFVYNDLTQKLVRGSAVQRVNDDQLVAALTGKVRIDEQHYKDGVKSEGFAAMIAPGIFLVLFYFSIVLLGNQMLNATVEEKENRVTEMVLTHMNPMNLLLGKVTGIFILGVIQVLVLILSALFIATGAAVFFSRDSQQGVNEVSTALSQLSFANIPIDPVRTLLGLGLFFAAFILVSGLLTMSGAMMSNAKDAGQVFGFAIMGLMAPYAALLLIMNEPASVVTQVMTWFPLTSPITVMIRNAVNNMAPLAVLGALGMQTLIGLFFFFIGSRLFGTGALTYQGMSVKQAFNTILGR